MLRTILAAAAAGVLFPIPALAQRASLFVGLDDQVMPYVEHLIRAGVIRDPDPLTRPLREGAIEAALRDADTLRAPESVRATVRQLLAMVTPRRAGAYFPMHFYGGIGVGSHSGRDPLRPKGADYHNGFFGWELSAVFGPAAVQQRIIFDKRIVRDPDYRGRKDTLVDLPALLSGYLSVQGKYGEFFLGSVRRNWGVPGVPAELVSPEPYPYDHLMGRLGVPNARVEGLLTELDDYQRSPDPAFKRYYASHRIFLRPWRWLTLVITQATLWYGVGRGIEFKWLNPVRFSATTRVNEDLPDSLNSQHGGQAVLLLPRGITLQGGLMIDDLAAVPVIGIGRSFAPTRAVFTGVADVPLSPALTVRGIYTAVTSLTYRTPGGPQEALTLHGIGLGRNYADYDQLSLSASFIPRPMTVIAPEITLLRQGEGDFRNPWPARTDTWPGLFEGVVERTVRIATTASVTLPSNLEFSGNAGLHFIHNRGHVAGVSDTRFVGGFRVTYHFGRQLPL